MNRPASGVFQSLVTFVALALFFIPTATAQGLLRIPDLTKGSEPIVIDTPAVMEKARATSLGRFPGDLSRADQAARQALRPSWFDGDLIGEMSDTLSKEFWGEAGKGILPGSRLGFGDENAAIYTEIAHVITGSWRFGVGSTLSLSTETEGEGLNDGTSDSTSTGDSGLDRFIAGGGSLSLQALRPVWRARMGDRNNVALIVAPRIWANIPALAPTSNVDDYGWEGAASMMYQRKDNDDIPFLTLEARLGWVAGSSAFYSTIGHEKASNFLYVAPTLTFGVAKQVNLGVSTFVSSDFETPGLQLSVSLLKEESKPAAEATGAGGAGN